MDEQEKSLLKMHITLNRGLVCRCIRCCWWAWPATNVLVWATFEARGLILSGADLGHYFSASLRSYWLENISIWYLPCFAFSTLQRQQELQQRTELPARGGFQAKPAVLLGRSNKSIEAGNDAIWQCCGIFYFRSSNLWRLNSESFSTYIVSCKLHSCDVH